MGSDSGMRAALPAQEGSNRSKLDELQEEMRELFSSKEKKVVKIDCKNMEESTSEKNTLLGKLYGGKNIKLQEIAEELHRGWQTRGTTKVEMIAKGFYKMEFEDRSEFEHVRKNGPWLIQGFIFSIKKGIHTEEVTTSRKFDLVDFWVQIYGIPVDRINEENVRSVGTSLGKVKEVDLCCRTEFRSPVARVRVRMDIKERLMKGIELRTEMGEVFMVKFKYEKLEIFCYFCGCIGHDIHYCNQREAYSIEVRKHGGSPRDINNNFSFMLRANVFYNGAANTGPAYVTIAGTPQKPRPDQIPARYRGSPAKRVSFGIGGTVSSPGGGVVGEEADVREKQKEVRAPEDTEHRTDSAETEMEVSVAVGEPDSNEGGQLSLWVNQMGDGLDQAQSKVLPGPELVDQKKSEIQGGAVIWIQEGRESEDESAEKSDCIKKEPGAGKTLGGISGEDKEKVSSSGVISFFQMLAFASSSFSLLLLAYMTSTAHVNVEQASTSTNPPFSWSSLFNDKDGTFTDDHLEFLETHSDNGVVNVPDDVLDEGIDQWSEYLIGYFVDKRMPFHLVKKSLDRAWKTKADYAISTDKNFFYFKFLDLEDRQIPLYSGPIFVAGRIFITKSGMSMIASKLGKPLRWDIASQTRSRLDFARACIEIPFDSEYPSYIKFKLGGGIVATVGVEYSWKPAACSTCRIFGPSLAKCPHAMTNVQVTSTMGPSAGSSLRTNNDTDANAVVSSTYRTNVPRHQATTLVVTSALWQPIGSQRISNTQDPSPAPSGNDIVYTNAFALLEDNVADPIDSSHDLHTVTEEGAIVTTTTQADNLQAPILNQDTRTVPNATSSPDSLVTPAPTLHNAIVVYDGTNTHALQVNSLPLAQSLPLSDTVPNPQDGEIASATAIDKELYEANQEVFLAVDEQALSKALQEHSPQIELFDDHLKKGEGTTHNENSACDVGALSENSGQSFGTGIALGVNTVTDHSAETTSSKIITRQSSKQGSQSSASTSSATSGGPTGGNNKAQLSSSSSS
ncbi:hypothetical protein IFM89_018861 [Coptis chinensis]|uniref:DUF4283 domain-containing protein n=1 Tax=Coptis chinensis TaxID=261450 RepID=A0A835HW70_9MAGN|nr:hypothetical protein IFM89_018861 [Coptis chinensis]